MAGTVAMGKDVEDACVDTAFRLIGTQGLRVADMSVCPLLPSSHTQSTAYIIGELAAERIAADHCLDGARSGSPLGGHCATGPSVPGADRPSASAGCRAAPLGL